MGSYKTLPFAYDRLTNDVPYQKIFEFYFQILSRYNASVHSVADLACGTGTLSMLFAQHGYAVTGIDASEEMLTVAYHKSLSLKKNRPFFIRQHMQNLHLSDPVDLTVCCLDSINYLIDPADVRKTFLRVYHYLKPGGVFIFDINTPYKFRSIGNQVFLDEDDDVYCVWRSDFSETDHIMMYGMDIFRRTSKVWRRSQEEHYEYAYELNDLCSWLGEVGFKNIKTFGDCRLDEPDEKEMRIFISAQKE